MMKKMLALLIIITISFLAFGAVKIVLAAPHQSQTDPPGNLPSIVYLGQGPGTFTIDPSLIFLVKTYDENGEFIFVTEEPPTFESTNSSERVWSTNFLPEGSNRYFHEGVNYGPVAAGCVVNFVQIEDNVDERRNYFYLDGEEILAVEQGMVTYGSFVIPQDGELSFYANDSIGLIVELCLQAVETPTSTNTPGEPTATNTATPEVTVTVTATPGDTNQTVTPAPGQDPTPTQPPAPTATSSAQTPVSTPIILPVTGSGPGPRDLVWMGAALLIAFVLLIDAWRRLWIWMRDGK